MLGRQCNKCRAADEQRTDRTRQAVRQAVRCAMATKAASSSFGVARIETFVTASPTVFAAACASLQCSGAAFGLTGLTSMAMTYDFGSELAQQLQVACPQCRSASSEQPGHVAARSRQARDQTGHHWIDTDDEYDRNGSWSRLWPQAPPECSSSER